MQYEPVIGLEAHVQLKTKSKLFCPCFRHKALADRRRNSRQRRAGGAEK